VPCDIRGLSDKLKPHSDIVSGFLSPKLGGGVLWCETFQRLHERDGKRNDAGLVANGHRRSVFSSGNEQLDQIRDLWGERREDDALTELEKFKTAQTWPFLNAEVRAKALRIEAGLRLQKGDAAIARKLFR